MTRHRTKKKRLSKAQRRRRADRKPARIVGIGDVVTLKSDSRVKGEILGWDLRTPGVTVWIVGPVRKKRRPKKSRGKSTVVAWVDEALDVKLEPWQKELLDRSIGTKVEAALSPSRGMVIIPPCPVCGSGMETNTPRPGIFGEHLPYYCPVCQQYRGES